MKQKVIRKTDTKEFMNWAFGEVEDKYCLMGLTPREKAERIIHRIKGMYLADETTYGRLAPLVGSYDEVIPYLFSEKCELSWEQRDFVIWCAFGGSDWTNYLMNNEFKFATDALERWGIIKALELYDSNEQDGKKWFESHKIPMQHVYHIVNNKKIIQKYPKLKSLQKKCSQFKCEQSINNTGRISVSQYHKLLQQATGLIKQGDYDKSNYELLNVMGAERSYQDAIVDDLFDDFVRTLVAQVTRIKTKEEMLQYLDLRHDLGWIDQQCHIAYGGGKEVEHILKVLGIDERETNIDNFDLKNSKDIARCKELFPLAFEYPFLFMMWYPSRENFGGPSYAINDRPVFVPNYDNGLEKKRKELHYKLATRGVLGKVASKTLVPEKLGKLGQSLEQSMADAIYQKRHPGRR